MTGGRAQTSTWAAVTAIAAGVLGNLIDGFDVLAIAFTAPAIARAWGVSPQLLGAVFSAGIAGITLGSLLLAPFAERVGRRRFVTFAMAAMAASMLGCAFAADVAQLVGLRFVTGLGVGAILPTLNSVVAEAAPSTRRNLTLSIFTAAYPLGSLLGGVLAMSLMGAYGWRSVFVVGGAATGVVAVLQWAWLPRVSRGQDREPGPSGLRALMRAPLLAPTVGLAGAFFFEMLVVFFVLNWTPRLLEMGGLPPQSGVAVAMVINLGSLFGGLTYGVLTDRFGWRRTGPAYAFGLAMGLAAFGAFIGNPTTLFALALAVGVFVGGSMTSLYALAPVVFPAAARVGGTGLVIGLGRCGGVLGPLLAASGLAAGFGAPVLYLGSAAGAAVVGGLIVALSRWWLGSPPEDATPVRVGPAVLAGETLQRPARGKA